MAAGTESLDAELLKDLRGLGKPPSFDGNDAEHQDFRFSIRIHMSLVSTVSQQLMDRCEVELNPISLAAVQALGDALFEVLHTDVLCIGLGDERQCPNSCPIPLRNPTEQRHGD